MLDPRDPMYVIEPPINTTEENFSTGVFVFINLYQRIVNKQL